MATTVTIVDQLLPGGTANQWALELLTERATARELIRSHIYQEVAEYNARTAGYFRGLVQPTEAERVLSGYRLREGRTIDWEAQFEQALAAFQRHGFLLLVDDRQLTQLDEEVVLQLGSQIAFLKLIPLVQSGRNISTD